MTEKTDFKFDRYRSDKIPKEKILEELEVVAKHFNFREFSAEEFNEVSKISSGTVKNGFGSWHKALTALKEKLSAKDLDLIPRSSRSHSMDCGGQGKEEWAEFSVPNVASQLNDLRFWTTRAKSAKLLQNVTYSTGSWRDRY